MKKHSIKPTFSELLDAACRDMPDPDALKPYLLSKLKEKFPSAASGIELEPSALVWERSKQMIVNKLQLDAYLQDLRWTSITGALLERVLYEKPKSVPAFLIELLAKGDVAAAGPAEDEDDLAATRMQAATRGRKARKAQKEKKEQNSAATKMQARQRGKKARDKRKKREPEVEVPEAADASEQVESAEAQMREAEEEAAAAAVMDDDKAATKMQAIQRGKQARKKKNQ